MRIRTCAQFCTDFPDDSVWEAGELVQFGGLNVAEALRELVAELGYKVSEPINGDDHGWWLNVDQADRAFLIQVTDMDWEVFLLTDDVTFFGNRWFSKNGHLYGEFVVKLKTAINADPRFSHIIWFEENQRGHQLGPDGKPLPLKEVQARSRARDAELRPMRRPKP